MHTELDCDWPRGANATHLLSFFHSDNTHQVCYTVFTVFQVFYSSVLYFGVNYVAYSYYEENMDNFSLKSAIKKRIKVLRTR